MFTSTPLQDTETLGQHKIEHLSTVFVIIQLPGGVTHTAGWREDRGSRTQDPG